MKIELTRRQMMNWGAAAGAGAVVGGGWIAHRSPNRLIGDILKRALPGLKINKADLRRFERDLAGQFIESGRQGVLLRAVSSVSGVVGLGAVSAVGKVKSEIAEIERAAVTLFLSNSDFFLLDDPKSETASYWGIDESRACPNPFAQF